MRSYGLWAMVWAMALERFWYDARLEERCWNDGRNMLMLELCYATMHYAGWFWPSGFAAGFCLASLVLLLVCFGLAGYAAGLLWLQ